MASAVELESSATSTARGHGTAPTGDPRRARAETLRVLDCVRQLCGYSLGDWARRAGARVSVQAISYDLQGRSAPAPETLAALTRALPKSLQRLLRDPQALGALGETASLAFEAESTLSAFRLAWTRTRISMLRSILTTGQVAQHVGAAIVDGEARTPEQHLGRIVIEQAQAIAHGTAAHAAVLLREFLTTADLLALATAQLGLDVTEMPRIAELLRVRDAAQQHCGPWAHLISGSPLPEDQSALIAVLDGALTPSIAKSFQIIAGQSGTPSAFDHVLFELINELAGPTQQNAAESPMAVLTDLGLQDRWHSTSQDIAKLQPSATREAAQTVKGSVN